MNPFISLYCSTRTDCAFLLILQCDSILYRTIVQGWRTQQVQVPQTCLCSHIKHCPYQQQVNIIGLKNGICTISNVDHGQIVSRQAWLEVVPLLLSFQATRDQACCEVAPKITNLKMNQESNHGVYSSVGNLLENWSDK